MRWEAGRRLESGLAGQSIYTVDDNGSLDANEVARRGLAADAQHRRSYGVELAAEELRWRGHGTYKNKGRERDYFNGNERELKMDLLINVEGNGFGGCVRYLLSVKNIRRKGEVDGNTIYWEYKKG